MNGLVRYIILYASGILTGVLITLLIVKVVDSDEPQPVQKLAFKEPKEVIKTDTIEKVIYKKAQKLDKQNTEEAVDSSLITLSDTSDLAEDTTQQELNINREQLIAVKNFTIKNISVDSTQSNALRDSLEASMGIHSDKNISSIRVEFWKSPLNFEGYILGKNVVRLYGVSEVEKLSFYRFDRNIYMRKADGTYTLIRSEEYHRFELSKEEINDKILQISGNG